MKTPGRAARPPQQLACDPPPTPSLLSPLASPLQRTGVRGPPQRVATPAAAQRDRFVGSDAVAKHASSSCPSTCCCGEGLQLGRVVSETVLHL